MRRKIIFTALLFGVLGIASAQEYHPNSKEYQALAQSEGLLGGDNIDILVINVLAANGINSFNATGVPRFTVVGKDRSYYLGIGGFARGTLSYDMNNPITNANLFAPSAIPMDQSAGNGNLLQLSGAVSNLAFNFVAMPHTHHAVGAYISFDFDGVGNALSLQNAYLKFCGFKMGYTPSLFTDLMAAPPTIDFQGPNSLTYYSNAVLDYEYQWGKNWGVGIGVEMPLVDYTVAANSYSVNQSIPDIPAYLQYSWNSRSSWVRLSGLLRNIQYHNTLDGKNYDEIGWGAKLSGSITTQGKFTTYYQVIYGEGISSYIQDMTGLGLDLLPTPQQAGVLDAVKAWGGYLGAQYHFTPKLFASATYSLVRTWGDELAFAPTQYRHAQYVATNIFWDVAPQVQLAAEYLWGIRENEDGRAAHNSRIQTMLQVNF